jgi:hypothetical protein
MSFTLGLVAVLMLRKHPMYIAAENNCTPYPCWHDIQVGKTSYADAKAIISKDESLEIDAEYRDKSFSWHSKSDPDTGGSIAKASVSDLVWGIYLHFSVTSQPTLQTLIRLWGAPFKVKHVDDTGRKADGVYIHFRNNVDAICNIEYKSIWLTPLTPIQQINFSGGETP